MKNKNIKKIFSLFALIYVFLTAFVYVSHAATEQYVPLAPIQGVNNPDQTTGENGLGNYFNAMYKLGVGLATGLAVLMIIWGGVEYATTDAIGGKEEGKERIQNALLGLLLALGSFLILRTVNKDLINVDLRIDDVQPMEVTKFKGADFVEAITGKGGKPDNRSILKGEGPEDPNVTKSINEQVGQLYESGSVAGKATHFGYNDVDDNGEGSALVGDGKGGKVDTNNTEVMGVALPSQVLEEYFGIPAGSTKYSDWASVRDAAVEVTGPSGQKEIVPIVDLGPGTDPIKRGVVIDETEALSRKMGGDGNRSYKIIPDYYKGKDRAAGNGIKYVR